MNPLPTSIKPSKHSCSKPSRKLSKRLSILLVSHNLGFVSSLVDHVLCVNHSVHIHPTTKMTGNTLAELFGSDLAVVRHDQSCPDGEHVHHHG